MSIRDFEAQDTISSLEIIARIDELEDLGEEERTGNEDEELEELQTFAEDVASYSRDWYDGVVVINDDYFETYIREQFEEIYDVDFDAAPFCNIDWSAQADDCMYDYTEVTLGMTSFFVSNN